MKANKLLAVLALCVIGGLAWYGSDQIARRDAKLELEKKNLDNIQAEVAKLKDELNTRTIELDLCKKENAKLVDEVASMTKYIESKAEVDDALQRLNRIAEKQPPPAAKKEEKAGDALPPGMQRLGSGNEIKIK